MLHLVEADMYISWETLCFRPVSADIWPGSGKSAKCWAPGHQAVFHCPWPARSGAVDTETATCCDCTGRSGRGTCS